MPNTLELDAEELDEIMSPAEEQRMAELRPLSPSESTPDLSNGGRINGVNLYPVQDRERVSKGRANSIRAWMWNGTETVLPLGWNPEGTTHNSAMPYREKRHCLCCHQGGFKKKQGKPLFCPQCVKSNCRKCRAGTDTTEQILPTGKKIKGWIIPCFYLRQEDVPYPERFYGDIDCFLTSCVRRGALGFKTEAAMRFHARGMHRMEYLAHQESIASAKGDELDSLKKQMAELQSLLLNQRSGSTPEPVLPLRPDPPVVGAGAAPLYLSDHPAPLKAPLKRYTRSNK